MQSNTTVSVCIREYVACLAELGVSFSRKKRELFGVTAEDVSKPILEEKASFLVSPFAEMRFSEEGCEVKASDTKKKNILASATTKESIFPEDIFSDIFPKENGGDAREKIRAFKEESSKFFANFDKNNLDGILCGLVYLTRKHLWSVSAGSGEKRDISFSEYARVKTAFRSIERVAEHKEKPYRYIVGELAGIQKYLFSLSKTGTYAKRLRGRSLFVQLITEDIKRYFLNQFGLPEMATIVSAGGKFLILLPNGEKTEEMFLAGKREVESRLWERFHGEVVLRVVLTEGLAQEEAERVSEFLHDTVFESKTGKYAPYADILQTNGGTWDEEVFIVPNSDVAEHGYCLLCNKYAIDPDYGSLARSVDEEGVCENCAMDIRLGRRLCKTNAMVWTPREKGEAKEEKKNKKYISLLFHAVWMEESSVESSSATFVSFVNQDIPEADHKKFHGGFSVELFASYIPRYKEDKEGDTEEGGKKGDAIDFSDLAGEMGHNKLALIKGDVDNLGNIFRSGIGRSASTAMENAARTATVSFLLTLFFEGWLQRHIQKNHPECYIVFSGGDDFMLIARWEKAIELLRETETAFSRFACCNENVHFSASVTLFSSHLPIFGVTHRGEIALGTAKDARKEKHTISIFSNCIFGEQADKLFETADTLYTEFVATGKVSSGSLHFLLDTIREKKEALRWKEKKADSERFRISLWNPHLRYHLKRLYDKETKWKKLCEYLLLEAGSTLGEASYAEILFTYLLYKKRDEHTI